MELNHDICYRAVSSRDARFDGRFFTAVVTTGIYCRPICPAKAPKPENCKFFPCAAAAQEAGFRPCLRCRPELSPMLIEQLSKSALVSRALRMIDEGALDDSSIDELADCLGIGERHLRRLFTEELGASPQTVAQNRRILFARQLLDQTALSVADVAMAAGFGSIRRFNDVMQLTYNRSPRELRRERVAQAGSQMTMRMPYHPPLNWAALLRFLSARVTPGVEEIVDGTYRRTIALHGSVGTIAIAHDDENACLNLYIDFPSVGALTQIVARTKRIFDIAANVDVISSHFSSDPILSELMRDSPGLRVPGTWDPFELAVRAILGQQVSVAAATTMCGRLAEHFGDPFVEERGDTSSTLTRVFPSPQALAGADLTVIGLTKARAKAISALSQALMVNPKLLVDFVDLDDAIKKLCSLPGIGEWTAHYIAMRALREPDAFPSSDLGLLKAAAARGVQNARELELRAESWRPWRAYAAMYLWQAPAVVQVVG